MPDAHTLSEKGCLGAPVQTALSVGFGHGNAFSTNGTFLNTVYHPCIAVLAWRRLARPPITDEDLIPSRS